MNEMKWIGGQYLGINSNRLFPFQFFISRLLELLQSAFSYQALHTQSKQNCPKIVRWDIVFNLFKLLTYKWMIHTANKHQELSKHLLAFYCTYIKMKYVGWDW